NFRYDEVTRRLVQTAERRQQLEELIEAALARSTMNQTELIKAVQMQWKGGKSPGVRKIADTIKAMVATGRIDKRGSHGGDDRTGCQLSVRQMLAADDALNVGI